jgi:hypothetical protein
MQDFGQKATKKDLLYICSIWKDSIKMVLRDVGYEGGNCI